MDSWQQCDTKIFWGEIAPCEHVVQIYENDHVFLDLLEGYVMGGFSARDSVVLILSEEHRSELYLRLYARDISLSKKIIDSELVVLDAGLTLDKFLVNNWPDEKLFMEVVSGIIGRSRKAGRPIRAFGEMVALLWAQGLQGATVQLEQLWNKFCEKEDFTLFCAYPRNGFSDNVADSMMHICDKHTKMVAAFNQSTTQLQYINTTPVNVAL